MLLWKLHVSPTLAKGLVQQGENGALPEGVAAVHQFIGAALEATLVGHLLVDRPLQETWRLFPTFQWPIQEPKLEVPTIYKAYVRPM